MLICGLCISVVGFSLDLYCLMLVVYLVDLFVAITSFCWLYLLLFDVFLTCCLHWACWLCVIVGVCFYCFDLLFVG